MGKMEPERLTSEVTQLLSSWVSLHFKRSAFKDLRFAFNLKDLRFLKKKVCFSLGAGNLKTISRPLKGIQATERLTILPPCSLSNPEPAFK